MTFDAALLTRMTETGVRVPVEFFVSVRAAREQPWQRQANNELMLRLLETGAVPPRAAIAQMSFEGRDAILEALREEAAEAAPPAEAVPAEAVL